jgi:hypothetical protein
MTSLPDQASRQAEPGVRHHRRPAPRASTIGRLTPHSAESQPSHPPPASNTARALDSALSDEFAAGAGYGIVLALRSLTIRLVCLPGNPSRRPVLSDSAEQYQEPFALLGPTRA